MMLEQEMELASRVSDLGPDAKYYLGLLAIGSGLALVFIGVGIVGKQ